jgi:aromatic ring hydroxylase
MADYPLGALGLKIKPTGSGTGPRCTRRGDEDYAISCVVPTAASGLKLYPRRPHALGPTSVFDYPLSSRLDATDSLVVFGDVFVAWEDVLKVTRQ